MNAYTDEFHSGRETYLELSRVFSRQRKLVRGYESGLYVTNVYVCPQLERSDLMIVEYRN